MADIMKMGKNPNFLGSWDLEELINHEVTLVIFDIKDESVVTNGKEELCTVCYWENKEFKPMIFNITNKKMLCKLYKTKDTEKLKGKAVTIGIEKVKAFGEIYDALRIRNKIPQQNAKILKCENCGEAIKAFGNMSADQVFAYRKKRYGKALCDACAKAAVEEEKK